MTEVQLPWILQGYKTFAFEGPNGLKVERLSKGVGKNKSSFYHHFANLEIFTTELLKYHLVQAKIIAQKEAQSADLQDFIAILIDHKIDFLFNRQLRVHRENTEFENCFITVNELSIPSMIPVWKRIIGLSENSHLAGLVLNLSLENFFLQITDETLNQTWLENYFNNIKNLVEQFKNSKAVNALDGNV